MNFFTSLSSPFDRFESFFGSTNGGETPGGVARQEPEELTEQGEELSADETEEEGLREAREEVREMEVGQEGESGDPRDASFSEIFHDLGGAAETGSGTRR